MNRKAASAKGGSAAPRASRKATKGHAQAGAVSSTGNLNALAGAVAAYTRGACAEAVQLVRPIVDAEPANFDALHLMAVSCAGSGDESSAMVWFDKAAALRPDSPELLCNRGNALRTLGRIEEALADYDHAVKVAPQFAGAWSNRALILLQLKRYAEAVDSTDRALALQPDLAEALNNRGNALRELKRPAEALASYDGAIKLRPDFAEAWSNRGNALRDVQRPANALTCYDRAVVLRPQYAVAWCNRGNVLRDLKRYDDALASYERAIQLWPGYALAWINHGNVLRDTQRHEEAIASYERAIAIDPASVDALCNIGVVQHTLERYADSLISYDHALAVDSNSARAWHNRGVALRMLKRNADALASYDRALTLQPNFPEALSNRGNSLRDLGDLDQAIVEFDRAIALRPDYPEAWCNRGAVLYSLNRFEEAIESLDRAIEIRPTFAVAHSNRGAALSELCRYEESIAAYDQAISLDPESAEAWLNRSLCRLQQGDFARGWAEYEWRWRDEQLKTRKRDFPQPLWLGREPLAGKTILLHAEQGLGDTLQFCRYVAKVAALGARVVLEVQVSLKDLMVSLPGVSQLLGKGEPLPAFDYHCPLLSLPLAFGTTLETIPHQVPYLQADEARLAKWRARLGPTRGMRVGLVWSGSPSHKNDRNRSLALELLSGLLRSAPKVEFVSLQKETRAADQAWLARHGGLKDFGAELVNFAETAALAACMDVVIAVDTSVAHLAGALGKKLWVLLPFNPDWRWLLERNDSPWYPNARLFRQSGPGAWPAVVKQVTQQLARLSAGVSAPAGLTPDAIVKAMAGAAAALGTGRFDEAAAMCAQVLAAQPDHFDARHLLGIVDAQRRRFAEAIQHFDQAMAVVPDNPHLLQNRAITLEALGRTEDALRSVEAALASQPQFAMAHITRGNLLIKLGRPVDALASFDAALALQPAFLEAHVNRGMALLHLGRPQDALASYEAALRIAPRQATVLFNKANVLRDLQRPAEALESIDRALEQEATNPQLHLSRGNTLLDLKRPAEALISFDRALALTPAFAEAHSNRGVALKLLGRVEEALKAFDNALAVVPDYTHALSNRGNALRETGRIEEALESFARALAIDPNYADALSSRAEVLRTLDRYDEALQSADSAIAVSPQHADAHVNRAIVLVSLLRQDEALVSIRRALALQPDSALAHLNHGITLLQTGQFAQGWPEFEWRWREDQLAGAKRPFAQPLWLGKEPLQGKTILLHAEQGLGDTLQFCRYVPLVAARGARVILEVQPALKRFLSGLAGVTTLIARGEALPAFDYQCPLMSLPLAFGTEIESVPPPPSLRADPALVKKWSARLGPPPGLRVGLVWSGSPTHRRDRERSISLPLLRKLLVPGVQFVSLQKMVRAEDAAWLASSRAIVDLSAEIDDMADTAALVESMDLVISVDTSVAHLAATLGRPTSMLLHYSPDWRWMLERADSPWYPSVSLHRQTRSGEWGDVIERVRSDIVAHTIDLDLTRAAAKAHATPDTAEAGELARQGNRAFREGRLDEARQLGMRALAANPKLSDALQLMGAIESQNRQHDQALAWLERLCASAPDYAEGHKNRGVVLHDMQRYDAALAAAERALVLKADYIEGLCLKGVVLRSLGRFGASLECARAALALAPQAATALMLQGVAQAELGRYADAVATYDRILALTEQNELATYNQGMCRLVMGDLPTGFAQYESRWRLTHRSTPPRTFSVPLWLGKESLAGKTILLHAEQGLGDTLQFCRYAKLVAARGARVILEVQVELKALLGSLAGVDTLIAKGEVMPPFDFHRPLLSLPLALGTTLSTIPAESSYLKADARQVEGWLQRLGPKTKPRIGLAWSGRPEHRKDLQRSLALEQLDTILREMRGVEFVVLQKEIRERDKAVLARHPAVREFSNELTDFADTAALVECMDLVIAVDTSVAHLAGALGKKSLILLPFNPDFRWLLNRPDSPWYPNATLLRQSAPGAWQAPLTQLQQRLSAMFPVGTPQTAQPDNRKETNMNRNVIRRPAPFVMMSSGHGTMIVNRNDYRMVDEKRGYGVGFQLLTSSWFDPDEVGIALQILDLRRKHFGDGVMALDCGANVGVHTVEWAKQMFGWGQVIGIEAQERIYYALAGNVAINNCLNASVRHAAVGASVGKLSIPRLDYCKPSSFGSFELKQRAGTEFIGQSVDYAAGNAQEIDLISIDSLRCPRLDFIKIDVEGMELEVLDGARTTIEAMRPQMLIESIKTDRARLLTWLTERGYQSLQLGINILAVHRDDPALADVLRLFNVGMPAAASAPASTKAAVPAPAAAAKPPRIVASISQDPAPSGAIARTPRVSTTTINIVPVHQRMNEAVAAFQARDIDTAKRICAEIFKGNPNYFDALHLMGVIEAQGKNPESALAYFDKANAVAPDNPQLLNNRAIALKDLYRNDEALASIDRALARDPNYAEAHANRGNVLRALGRPADALTSLDRAIAYRPNYAEAHSNRGNVLQDLGRFEEAVASYDKGLALNANYAEAWSNRGNALRELRRYDEALASHDRAVKVEPGRAVTHNNRGNVLRDLDRREEGLASYDQAIKLMPDYAEAWSNRGNLLQDMGRHEEAMESYDRALQLRDQLPEAHLNQSFCRLLGGDFAKGWEQYEWRWRDRQMERLKRNFTQPLWLGGESIKGRTILLHAEQGLGDTLQFCRYAALVAAQGARVLLEVQAPLKGLLTGLPGVEQLIGKGETLPRFDYQTPLMSLPLALGTRVDTVPGGVPYVKADATRVAQWRKKLGKKAKGAMRIGLVWSGRAEHKNDRNRSLALSQFADLIKGAKAGTQFVSLQKEMRPADAAWLKQHGGVLDVSADLKTFEDTAALIELMDVVISVDTSIAHLAGAMGKPLRLLLPFQPDFRWMRERTDSPWYPQAKLYRKPLNGTWDTVLEQVGTDLAS